MWAFLKAMRRSVVLRVINCGKAWKIPFRLEKKVTEGERLCISQTRLLSEGFGIQGSCCWEMLFFIKIHLFFSNDAHDELSREHYFFIKMQREG